MSTRGIVVPLGSAGFGCFGLAADAVLAAIVLAGLVIATSLLQGHAFSQTARAAPPCRIKKPRVVGLRLRLAADRVSKAGFGERRKNPHPPRIWKRCWVPDPPAIVEGP